MQCLTNRFQLVSESLAITTYRWSHRRCLSSVAKNEDWRSCSGSVSVRSAIKTEDVGWSVLLEAKSGDDAQAMSRRRAGFLYFLPSLWSMTRYSG
ncbi:hypothetical protein J6590_007038 [Homalodisca vitripennis]|nr:hypothetical protein J6590_007038 [Homalodisca vitripennis]